MIKKISILFGVIFFANNVFSQGGMGGGAEEVYIPDVDEESFIWQIPSKWYPYSKESEIKIDVYLFPTGQEPTDFKEMLHFEEFRSTMNAVDAESVYQLKTQAASAGCPTYQHELEVDQTENGYSMVQWSENCITDSSTIYALTKVIVGNEKLYIAKKAWKYEPRESEQIKWNDLFMSVYVCDPTTGENRCTPPNGGRGGGGGGR